MWVAEGLKATLKRHQGNFKTTSHEKHVVSSYHVPYHTIRYATTRYHARGGTEPEHAGGGAEPHVLQYEADSAANQPLIRPIVLPFCYLF